MEAKAEGFFFGGDFRLFFFVFKRFRSSFSLLWRGSAHFWKVRV